MWREISTILKEKSFWKKTEDKYHWRECSQKWSNLQKGYKKCRAAAKRSGAAASEAWPFDSPIEALLGEEEKKSQVKSISYFSWGPFSHFSVFCMFQRVDQW